MVNPLATAIDRSLGEQAASFAPQIPIEQLPPMPPPARGKQLLQEWLGCTAVIGGSGLVLGVTSAAVVLQNGQLPWWANGLFIAAVVVNVVLAWGGLWGMLYTDPGNVLRSAATCYPIPEEVLSMITATGRLDTMKENITTSEHASGQAAASYCVRCCVWRPHGAHHCRLCQRCVLRFDHHCNFYGRCVGGQSQGLCGPGNMKYFRLVFTALHCGVPACVVYLFLALILRADSTANTLAISLGCGLGLLAVVYCCKARGFCGMFAWLCQRGCNQLGSPLCSEPGPNSLAPTAAVGKTVPSL